MAVLSNIAKQWEIDHARGEMVAFRILDQALRDMALSIPLRNFTPVLIAPAIEANITPEKLAPAITRIWMRTASQSASRQRDEIVEQANIKALPTREDITEHLTRLLRTSRRVDLFSMALTFSGYLNAKITSILEETEDQTAAITAWLAFLASREFYRYQIARIARTETTGAANWGRQQSTQIMGILTQKTWLTMLDERVRDRPFPGFNHRVLHGVTIGSEELFSQGGVSLSYPGDPRAQPPLRSAGMIINCRCLAVYTPATDARGRTRIRF